MQFTQTPQVGPLYVAADGPTAGALLYLLPKGTEDCPATLAFDEAWQRGGAYLFLEQAPGEFVAFAQAAWAFLADPRMVGTRFAWLDPLGPSGLLSGTAVAAYQPTGQGAWVTGFPVSFGLRNVALGLAAGAAIAVDDSAFAFRFGSRPADVWLTAGGVACGSVTTPVTVGCTGPLAGCLQGAVDLSLADLQTLGAGLKFFYAIPPDESQPDLGDDFFLGSLHYPLLATGATVQAVLDPLAALDRTRTYLALGSSALPSHLRTTLGDQVKLAPQTGAALVFAVDRQSAAPFPADPLYLVPAGDFQLQTAEAGPAKLMCGVSGVEYVGLPGDDGNPATLSFVPGNDAFATGFFPGRPAGWTALAPQAGEAPTTSYARVAAKTTTLTYYAQPDQSVLYNYPTPAPPPPPNPPPRPIVALAPILVPAATIPAPPTPGTPFPLLPFAGLSGDDLAPYAQLEWQVVSPQRRLALGTPAATERASGARAAATIEAPASKYSTTPQGLLAQFTPGDTIWQEIVLAAMPVKPPLLLQQVQGKLLAAFQSNKLFLVISNPAALASVLVSGNDEIGIGATEADSWSFDLGLDVWPRYGTILIVKFTDASIEQLASGTGSWAYPSDFNTDAEATSQAITGSIRQAKAAQAKGDSDFDTFVAAVTDAAWNGILALNVQAPLTALPAQLAGLAAGIDDSRFFAHHVAISASRIDVPATPGDLSIRDSSIFALIDYQGEKPAAALGSYAFTVESLRVLFLNSEVASFSSILDLEVNALFGEPATLANPEDGDGNIIRLYGVGQRHASGGQVNETYTFQTRSGVSSVFDVKSEVLNAVELSKGQFVTVTADSSAKRTDAQFQFWGLADFKRQPELDVFSFGREDGATTPAGLSFSNLVVGMSFDPTQTPRLPTFAFDASQLGVDMATSVARNGSLFRHFPLTLAGVTQGLDRTKPTDAGYMGVTSPLPQADLEFPWFSLNFDLNLGSPGALAAKAGFVASLGAAWSPSMQPTERRIFTGLKLPGSSGAKRQIPIEGIFDIGFKSLELIVHPDTSNYVLVLYGIGFEFLSLTFPPTGQVNFVLFGDPTAQGKGDTGLGWYAAYAKPDQSGSKK